MALVKKLIAVGLILSLMLNVLPANDISAVQDEPTFDYKTGEKVTYYLQGQKSGNGDELKSKQWALYNDGTFKADQYAGSDIFDIYDSMFGFPSMSDWGDLDDMFGFPSMSDFDNLWDSFFGDSYNGWGSYFGFSSRGWFNEEEITAVKGIDINATTAMEKYNSNTSNKDVIVAVIDTGIDYSHEDLADSVWVNEDEIPDNGIDDDKNGYVDDVYGWNFYNNSNVVFTGSNDDHGTHCAGTIAAQTDNGVGVASITGGNKVKVMVLKALGGWDGTGENLSVVQAIKYAEANGASIVNLSFGSSYSDELLYNTIASSKMLFVVAAGNGNDFSGRGYDTDRTPCYPASYNLDNIISVANLSYNGNLDSSSNYGEKSVDIAAPGTDIISTAPRNSYEYMSGTSMSAPFVTAAAALVYSYYDGITLGDVKEIILNSAKKLDSLSGKTVTGGMLDVDAALSYDVTKLAHKELSGKTKEGKAPVLSYTAYRQNNKIYITVTVTDEDNDVYGLFYEDGELNAKDFAMGLNGERYDFKRNSSNTAYFVASDYGTYSFYVVDGAGHETVLVVNLTEDNVEDRSGSDGQSGRYPYGRDYSGRTPTDKTPTDKTPTDKTPADETPRDKDSSGRNPFDGGSYGWGWWF